MPQTHFIGTETRTNVLLEQKQSPERKLSMLKSTITCVLHPSRQVSIWCMVHVFVETFNTSFSKQTQEHLSNWNPVKYHIHANHEAVHCVALWTRVTLGLDMCKVCTEAVHCVALWTRVTLGLDMCKVCTEAVHCVALWTRVTLGLDMCKVCTEAVHCVALKLGKQKSSLWETHTTTRTENHP